jgi:predicted nuclease of predicted toxin-antitoxin system
MRLKLDENLPRELIDAVRQAGHDAHTVLDERLDGHADDDIWRAAVAEDRIVISTDNDFGRLATHTGTHPGVFIIRPGAQSREAITLLGLRALGQIPLEEWRNRIVVAEDARLRIRPPLRIV